MVVGWCGVCDWCDWCVWCVWCSICCVYRLYGLERQCKKVDLPTRTSPRIIHFINTSAFDLLYRVWVDVRERVDVAEEADVVEVAEEAEYVNDPRLSDMAMYGLDMGDAG